MIGRLAQSSRSTFGGSHRLAVLADEGLRRHVDAPIAPLLAHRGWLWWWWVRASCCARPGDTELSARRPVNTPAACGCRIGSIRRRVVDLLEPAPVSAQCPELPAARRPVRRQRTACTDHVRVRRNTPALPVFATAAGPRSRAAPDTQRCHETISRPCPSALSGHFDLVLSLTCVSLAAQKQPPTMTAMNSLGYFSEPTYITIGDPYASTEGASPLARHADPIGCRAGAALGTLRFQPPALPQLTRGLALGTRRQIRRQDREAVALLRQAVRLRPAEEGPGERSAALSAAQPAAL